jgi:hypothetical protein
MRSRVWVLAAIGVFLSACAAGGMGAATAPGYPPAVYNQRVATEDINIYWTCTRSAEQVQIEGVAQNTRGGQVSFVELEFAGADAHDRYVSNATTALKDIVLQTNQVSPFTIQLRPTGGESRFDLFYKYNVDVAVGKSPQERFMARDVCSPTQHQIQR